MRILALVLLLQFAPQQTVPDPEPFVVEQLSQVEVEQRDKADKELLEAQQKHDSIIHAIEAAHGQTQYMQWGPPCGWVRDVQLKGKYALVTNTMHQCWVNAAR